MSAALKKLFRPPYPPKPGRTKTPESDGPSSPESPTLPQPAPGSKMGTSADTLVADYPTRVAQLNGPVYDYLKPWMPFSETPQNLYMSVFYPKARDWPPSTELPENVQDDNPGITTVQDYVDLVNKAKGPTLLPDEERALRSTATKLGVSRDSLYHLIALESGWNPQATNKISGARGLIQFMPKTAKGMGFKATSLVMFALFLAGLYWLGKR